MATFFSSAAMLGAPGAVYKEGVVFALFALNVPLSGAAIYVLGNRIRKLGHTHGHVTPADLICKHYGSSVALRCLVALIGFYTPCRTWSFKFRPAASFPNDCSPGNTRSKSGPASCRW